MIRRALMMLALLASVTPAAAQTAPPDPTSTPARRVRLFADTAFHMGIEQIASQSQDFVYQGEFGGRVDFLDWGRGRGIFVANYQVIMGEELKAFDPNQGNYVLGFAGSSRFGRNELAGVFHHESRHLSDRTKFQSVDWNSFGARLTRTASAGALALEAEGQLLGIVQKSFVDYNWVADGRLRSDLLLRPGVGVLMNVDLRVFFVDDTFARGTQAGIRAEGGLRFDGDMGAIEVFVSAERRVDPYLLRVGTANFAMAGFRLLSR